MKGKTIITIDQVDKTHKVKHKHTLNNYDAKYGELIRAFYDLSLAAGYSPATVDKFINLDGE